MFCDFAPPLFGIQYPLKGAQDAQKVRSPLPAGHMSAQEASRTHPDESRGSKNLSRPPNLRNSLVQSFSCLIGSNPGWIRPLFPSPFSFLFPSHPVRLLSFPRSFPFPCLSLSLSIPRFFIPVSFLILIFIFKNMLWSPSLHVFIPFFWFLYVGFTLPVFERNGGASTAGGRRG